MPIPATFLYPETDADGVAYLDYWVVFDLRSPVITVRKYISRCWGGKPDAYRDPFAPEVLCCMSGTAHARALRFGELVFPTEVAATERQWAMIMEKVAELRREADSLQALVPTSAQLEFKNRKG